MNPSSVSLYSPESMSGAVRYERIAILEAALRLKEHRQRQKLVRIVFGVVIVSVTIAGFVIASTTNVLNVF